MMEDPLKIEHLDLNKVCGICLIKQENLQFISDLVSEMLKECVSVELPSHHLLICEICEEEVRKWHSFKQQVLKAFEIQNITSNLELRHLPIKEEITEDAPQLKKHKCNSCDLTFVTHGQLRTHLVTHKIQEGYECEACNKKFRSARSLWGHKRRHCQIKHFPCPDCDKTFPFKHALDRHFQARHSTESNFLCSYCPKRYKVRESLAVHMKKAHLGKSPNAVCNMCGKQCVSEANMRVHLRTHTGERPFLCDFCSKDFLTKDHLTLHRRIHTGERPHKCEECGKGFISSSVLQKHKRSHTGERPYKCHLCHKTFALSSAYKTHLKSH